MSFGKGSASTGRWLTLQPRIFEFLFFNKEFARRLLLCFRCCVIAKGDSNKFGKNAVSNQNSDRIGVWRSGQPGPKERLPPNVQIWEKLLPKEPHAPPEVQASIGRRSTWKFR